MGRWRLEGAGLRGMNTKWGAGDSRVLASTPLSGNGGKRDKGEGEDSHNGLAETVLCPMVGHV